MYVTENMSPNYSYNEKCFRQKLWRKSKHIFVFNKNLAVYENVEKCDRARQATNKHVTQRYGVRK